MKEWPAKILLALAGVVISLFLVELGLGILRIEYPLFYDFDPVLGNSLRPGVQGYFLSEGKGYVSINSDGLRDREHSISPPENTLRIAVLGDSYAEAMQVNQDETFWAVMERELQKCENLRGRNVEVINFGVSAFGTTQELLILQHRAWKYKPDIVLLSFVTANDIMDNSRTLKQIDYHPYHVFQGDELILDDRQTQENWSSRKDSLFRRVILRNGIDRWRVFQVIHHFKGLFWKWWSLQNFGRKAGASVEGQEPGINEAFYREPTTEAWREAWKVTEGVLLLMRDEVARQGARFFVVVLTTGAQVDPDSSRSAAFARFLGVDDLFYPDRRLQKFCQDHHIPVLLLGPPLAEYAIRHQVYLHGFGSTLGTGHWNQDGHRLAGQIIAQWLGPQLR